MTLDETAGVKTLDPDLTLRAAHTLPGIVGNGETATGEDHTGPQIGGGHGLSACFFVHTVSVSDAAAKSKTFPDNLIL